MIDRLFQLRARGTDLRTEVVGGASTFAALSYIVFVQPAVLATTGMEPGAVLAATCLASAFATALMGLWANYPTLVINGDHDVIIYTINSYILQQNIPNAQLILYPDASHGAFEATKMCA